MADNPYAAPPPPPRNVPPGGGPPLAPPGGENRPGFGGMPTEAPPRPWWETAVLVLCGLCLAPFFFPDAVIAPLIKLTIGVVAVALLILVFARRIRAMRGQFVAPHEQVQRGGPKPYHLGRQHDPHKR